MASCGFSSVSLVKVPLLNVHGALLLDCSFRWAEVSLLLRKPILQEEDMLYTVAAAEAGLIYTEEVRAFDVYDLRYTVYTRICLD